MPKFWTDIREWIAEEDRLIRQGFDSITAFTGEEGAGKSIAMLAKNKLSDPDFYHPGAWSEGWKPTLPTDRVFFEEEDFMRGAITMPPGAAVQLDEADAHRRSGMTRQRRKFLKFLKERRSLRLRATIGFPHVTQIDRDILRSRVRYRAHVIGRGDDPGLLVVKSRVVLREEVDNHGNPITKLHWPERGRFPIPDFSGLRIIKDYGKKKDAFTHRDDDLEQPTFEARRIDEEAALPVIDRIKSALTPLPVNQAFYSEVLADLAKSP